MFEWVSVEAEGTIRNLVAVEVRCNVGFDKGRRNGYIKK